MMTEFAIPKRIDCIAWKRTNLLSFSMKKKISPTIQMYEIAAATFGSNPVPVGEVPGEGVPGGGVPGALP
jgi:hypothetical protein